MAQGLSKNTPVKLSFTKENYEALLTRHGQWIRWRIAKKCACINPQNNQPNLHCKLCGGRGLTYTYQSSQTVTTIASSNGSILTLESEFENDTLVKVYDYNGNVYSTAGKYGVYIDLGIDNVTKGTYFNVVLTRDNIYTLKNVELTKLDSGYYEVSDLINKQSNTDGLYYSSPSDIIEVGTVTDSEGNVFSVSEKRLNQVYIEGSPVEPVTCEYVKYIKPYSFGLVNQNLNTYDLSQLQEVGGDAVLLFPYSCDVAEGDIITVLAATITQKDIIAHTSNDVDKLPSYFVESITNITGSDGTEYYNGTDYILSDTNSVKWLIDDIEEGEAYSITYKVYPTYTVTRNIPMLRSSENQRMPKKAIVKYLSTYTDSKAINRQ